MNDKNGKWSADSGPTFNVACKGRQAVSFCPYSAASLHLIDLNVLLADFLTAKSFIRPTIPDVDFPLLASPTPAGTRRN